MPTFQFGTDDIHNMEARIAELTAEVASLRDDAERYRAIRSWHESRVGKKKATVVMWDDEPWEPENGKHLDESIDIARNTP